MVGNDYSGWRVPQAPDERAVDVLIADQVQPEQFWADYVSKRKPVVLKGQLPDPGWSAGSKWTDEYLAEHAGACQLQVEVRDGPSTSFGHGSKQPMSFKDLLARMQQGDESLYLTTQKVPCASDGHPALLGQPLTQLSDDFVLQPQLTGHLVPQQMNLWMGCAKSGSSSGLHHDFHDNLYVLLRGRKRFRLWDPSQAPAMHTAGKVTAVHTNGRIMYQGQEEVNADGSSVRDAAGWAARGSAEARVAQAEQAVKDKLEGSSAQLAAAEEALEKLMEAQLEAAITGEEEGGMDVDALQDDYVDDEDDELDPDEDTGDDEDDDGDEPDQDAGGPRGRGRRGLGASPAKRTKQAETKSKAKTKGKGKKSEEESKVVAEPDPPSFCTGVDLSLSDAVLRKRFPGFPGKAAMLEVTVEAGQMLYLPAGWFHEVTSFSVDDPAAPPPTPTTRSSRRNKEQARAPTSHAAFNYWFHPPDGDSFSKPYKSDYWPSLWRARCESMGVANASPHPAAATCGGSGGTSGPHSAAATGGGSGGSGGPQPFHSVLVHHDAPFDGVKVDEVDGATGHDPHRGPRHSFEGVHVDELEGGTGHDPHRGPRHSFEGVHVDEKDGGTGHDPHRGKGHHFKGVHVDEVEGGTGHDPHRGPRHSFDGVKADEAEGATGHDPHRGEGHHFEGVHVDEAEGATGHDPHRGEGHHFEGVHVDEAEGATGHDPHRGTGHHFEGVKVDEAAGTAAQPSDVPMLGEDAAAPAAAAPAPAAGRKGGRKGAAPKRLAPEDPHPATAGSPQQASCVVAVSGPDAPPGSHKKQRKGSAVVGEEEAGAPAVIQLESQTQPASTKGQKAAAGKAAPATAAATAKGPQRGGSKAAAAAAAAGSDQEMESKSDDEDEGGSQDEEMGKGEDGVQGEEEAGEGEGEDEGEEEEGEEMLEGDEGELGEMVAKEMGQYFQSEEGSGAFKLALREYLLKALAEGGIGDLTGEGEEGGKGARPRRMRRSARQRGRRHHRVVRVDPNA